MVTESLDDDANVIWGARVSDEMEGKLTVMAIITGVHSPWLLGNEGNRKKQKQQVSNYDDDLQIEIL